MKRQSEDERWRDDSQRPGGRADEKGEGSRVGRAAFYFSRLAAVDVQPAGSDSSEFGNIVKKC